MLNFEGSPKKATNLSLSTKMLETARDLGMNLSQTVETLLSEAVKKRYWEKWREDNQEAFEAYNERIRREGLPLAKYSFWAKGLGDGKDVPSASASKALVKTPTKSSRVKNKVT